MMDIVVMDYENENAAQSARSEFLKLQEEAIAINPQDAVVIVKTPEGNIKLQQAYEYFPDGLLFGSWFGMVIGFLLGVPFGPLGPLVGTAVGTALGVITGTLSDAVALNEFKKEVQQIIQPGKAALFILSKSGDTEKIIKTLKKSNPQGKVIKTTVDKNVENKLRDAIERKAY